jgi:hypothetical protein
MGGDRPGQNTSIGRVVQSCVRIARVVLPSPSGWLGGCRQPRVDHHLPVVVQGDFCIGKQGQEGFDQLLDGGHCRLLGFVRISLKKTRPHDMEAESGGLPQVDRGGLDMNIEV